MPFVMRKGLWNGPYLEWADPDARHGRGDSRWTDDRKRAQRFPTIDAAMRYWQAQSRVVPYRPDGIVNRPLTAYHVTVERVEDQNDRVQPSTDD